MTKPGRKTQSQRSENHETSRAATSTGSVVKQPFLKAPRDLFLPVRHPRQTKSAPPGVRAGRLVPAQSLFCLRLRDQMRLKASPSLDEVGVDRSGEARIVELDREVVAAFVGALRPGGPDLGAADKDPMAGGIVVRPVGLGDDADALALQAQGDDLALEFVAGLLEGADVCHVTSPWLFEPATIAASMAICRPKAIDDAPILGRSAAEDGGAKTFLAREEWAKPRGRKS